MQPITVVIPGYGIYNEYLHYINGTRFLPQFILKLAVEAAILKHDLKNSSALDEAIADEVSEFFADPANGLITHEQKYQLDTADQKAAEVLWAPIVDELNSVIDTVLNLASAMDGVLQTYLDQKFFTDTYEVLGAMFFSGSIYITFGVYNAN